MREEDGSNVRGGETDMDLYTPVDSLVMAPHKEIYLQWSEEVQGTDDCTWCQDQVNDNDTRYVRADIYEALVEAVNSDSPLRFAADLNSAADYEKRIFEALRQGP
jgi:hypothetical protein